MVEVLEGLHSIDLSEKGDHSLESWVLNCPEGVVIIDTGMNPSALDKIYSELKSIGKDWSDVKLILITHKHRDHIANLAKLKELTDAPVKSHRLEAPLIEKATDVKVEGLEDGTLLGFCGGIRVVHVPGHSEGNSCYYLSRLKAMIAGDTVFSDDEGNLIPPPEKYCLDVKMAMEEIKRLLDYDFKFLLYTHGKDVMEGAREKVKELVEKTRLR
ncbi:MBL fold metallo-hydrolase [Candidatus Bathyarchaeota archaeon]|nr:MBL fold metallo-hydrolase [Candidatus Bathyarchaeota archaeon]